MANISKPERPQVAAYDASLRGCVEHEQTNQRHEKIEIAELPCYKDAILADGGCRDCYLRDLLRDKPSRIIDGAEETGNPIGGTRFPDRQLVDQVAEDCRKGAANIMYVEKSRSVKTSRGTVGSKHAMARLRPTNGVQAEIRIARRVRKAAGERMQDAGDVNLMKCNRRSCHGV
ncbi:hypothetical protein E4U09_000258 [Claviceps aff. purpurea]|uniref:Uncharacterized protein n=1 Tax=Claviceps aff. purpurea TaxID=1967640 RepID=A0A9P7U308_9HYPO|nr:hypothetical protein E4U09_000258 [Claviceps aff. purpurea]